MRSPQGHSFGAAPAAPVRLDAQRWWECEEYLFGVDLFNAGYWWESHEAWEPLWQAAGRRSSLGLFLQGLIQLAVACLKRSQGRERAALRLGGDALRKLALMPDPSLGIATRALRERARAYLEGERGSRPPRIALDIPGPGSHSGA